MRRFRDDRGAALVMVVLLGFVSIVLVGTGLTAATSGLRQAASSQRSASALDAAFAGVQDYISRVNADDSYVKFGNPLSAFTIASGAAAGVKADAANPAFGVAEAGADATWAVVPGSDGLARFRYEVDNSAYKTTGVIRLRSTGFSGERVRSVIASLRVRSFVDYGYFTDLELQDPAFTGAPDSCVKHVWEGRPVDCGGVPDISFRSTDALSGDVHSNDQMIICGATFTGNITTGQTAAPLYSTRNCATSKKITNISHADPLPLPATNTAMKTDAGCLYTGPTQITYSADGTMTVVSPWTTAVKDVARCGAPAQLATTAGARVNQLDQDLLYVQNVPSASTPLPAGFKCIDSSGSVSAATDGIGWALTSGDTTIRYPLSGEAPATTRFNVVDTAWSTTAPAYGCRNGDLYVKGTVGKTGSGAVQTTAASENYIYVTGDLKYEDRGTDVLGLVGQNAVFVWNPITRSAGNDTLMLTDTGREIDAAVVSVAHTFMVQNYDRAGTRGVLTVFGSIAQRFRGSVAASYPDTGYTKGYAYDARLKTTSPPKFLAPTAKTFLVMFYGSVAAAYGSTGAPIS